MAPVRRNMVGERWLRGPWLREEDIRVLNGLPMGAAKSFECLLQQQVRSNKRFETHTVSLDMIMEE